MERPVKFFGRMRLSKKSQGGSWTKKQKLSATKMKIEDSSLWQKRRKWKTLLLLGILTQRVWGFCFRMCHLDTLVNFQQDFSSVRLVLDFLT
jgi:hypothetical protein